MNDNYRSEVLKGLRCKIREYLEDVEDRADQKVYFCKMPPEVNARADYRYDEEHAPPRPRIRLKPDFKDWDVAHEVCHMEEALLRGFPIFWGPPAHHWPMGRIQTYVRDEATHARLVDMGLSLVGEVLNESVFSEYEKLAGLLRAGRDWPDDRIPQRSKLLFRVTWMVQASLIRDNWWHELDDCHRTKVLNFTNAFHREREQEACYAQKVLGWFCEYEVDEPGGCAKIMWCWAQHEHLPKEVELRSFQKRPDGGYTSVPMRVDLS